MNKDEIFATIREILVRQLEVKPSQVKLKTSFKEDLDAESLAMVELILALEEEFGVSISDDEAQDLTTVGETVDFIAARS
jgi:acyl carrier protein